MSLVVFPKVEFYSLYSIEYRNIAVKLFLHGRYVIRSMAIRAVQIWIYSLFSQVPKKVLIVGFGLMALKNPAVAGPAAPAYLRYGGGSEPLGGPL